MPQFDLAVFLPQIFWLVICFTVLYTFTVGYSMPRLKKVYEERWQFTEGTRLEAVKLHRQAQDITQAYEKELERARMKANDLVNHELREIAQESIDRKNQILAEMKKKFVNAELRLSERKMHTLIETQPLAQMLSAEIVLKLMKHRLPPTSIKQMVSKIFKERVVNDL